jgi:hypothetical protein
MPMPVPLFWNGFPVFQALDEKVVVVAKSQKRDVSNGIYEFADGVTVQYGPTRIVADRLIYTDNATGRFAEATGKVSLLDPEGEMRAERVRIDWLTEGTLATAENLFAELAGTTIRAEKMELKPGLWTLFNVSGTTCRQNPPLIEFFSRRVVFVPGKSGKVEKPSARLFGINLPQLPSQSFNLDRRARGIQIPSFSAIGDQGPGIVWGGSFLVGGNAAVGFDFGTFERALPTYGVTYARSFVPADKSNVLIVPRDELGERFNYGWFDTVEVPTPAADLRFVRENRKTLAVSTSVNRGSANTYSQSRFTRPLELTFEASGPVNEGAAFGQIKLQSVGSQQVSQTVRGIVTGTYVPPQVKLSKELSVLARLDQQMFLGRETYAWVRSQLGLSFEPASQLRIGAAFVNSKDFGRALFSEDRLQFGNGIHLRAGLNLGPTKIEYLYKWDRRSGWYDREIAVNQVFGCLEAYVMRRQVPQVYRVGIKLRVDQFVDLLQRRKLERTKTEPTAAPKRTVISQEKS